MNKPCLYCGSDFDREQGLFTFWKCGTWMKRELGMDVHGASDECIAKSMSAKLAQVRANYDDLIMRVSRKFDGETRHQTAARYIDEAEAMALKSEPANHCISSETTEGRQDVTTDGSQQYVGSSYTAP